MTHFCSDTMHCCCLNTDNKETCKLHGEDRHCLTIYNHTNTQAAIRSLNASFSECWSHDFAADKCTAAAGLVQYTVASFQLALADINAQCQVISNNVTMCEFTTAAL